MDNSGYSGEFQSPGGFVFGVQGWMWGEPRPTCITFFLDNTAKVSDQHGRPIKGIITADNKEIRFAQDSPMPPDSQTGVYPARAGFATHAEVIAALAEERVDWTKLTVAGWPQLTYDELKKLKVLPRTPIEELRKIVDPALRKDALRIRREADEARSKEMQAVETE